VRGLFDDEDPMTIRWRRFHKENPVFWTLFEKYALEACRSGRRVFGARMIWERMRWYTMIETTDHDFKLNDHYIAYYSRLFMRTYPAYAHLFQIRSSTADQALRP
jgi:hypothetical protein